MIQRYNSLEGKETKPVEGRNRESFNNHNFLLSAIHRKIWPDFSFCSRLASKFIAKDAAHFSRSLNSLYCWQMRFFTITFCGIFWYGSSSMKLSYFLREILRNFSTYSELLNPWRKCRSAKNQLSFSSKRHNSVIGYKVLQCPSFPKKAPPLTLLTRKGY